MGKVTNLRELIVLHEGRVSHAYKDSRGYLTIGVGHLIDKRKGGRLPDFIIDLLLAHDIEEHSAALFAALPWAKDLDDVRKAVLIDMHFNLGPQMTKWRHTMGAVQAGKWQQAADHMLDSEPWASQVKGRAVRLADMMQSGQWPDDGNGE